MAVDKKAQQASALVSLFVKEHNKKYVSPLVVNRYKEKWGMVDVIDSIGYDRAREVIEYYFKTSKSGHPLQWFLYNFENLDKVMRELDEDKIKRERLRARTAQRAAEWEERQSELRSETNQRPVQE